MISDLLLQCFITTRDAHRKLHSEYGQTLAEYGLIMSVISIAVMLAAVFAFREAIPGAYASASKCLDAAC